LLDWATPEVENPALNFRRWIGARVALEIENPSRNRRRRTRLTVLTGNLPRCLAGGFIEGNQVAGGEAHQDRTCVNPPVHRNFTHPSFHWSPNLDCLPTITSSRQIHRIQSWTRYGKERVGRDDGLGETDAARAPLWR